MKPPITNPEDSGDIIDPLEAMLHKTGCINLHYKVQECIASTQDWRRCQTEVQEFRACMSHYSKAKLPSQDQNKS